METLRAKFVGKIDTRFMLNIFPQNRAIYEIYVFLCNLCIFTVMSIYSYCVFIYLKRASWHSSATLTELFP